MWGAQGWNQWALQPSMFNNVPHDEIDWAALAKQWIQMQKPPEEGDVAPGMSATPVVPPTISVPHPLPSEGFARDEIPPGPMGVDQFAARSELPNPPSRLPEPVPNFGPQDATQTYWHPEWEANMSGDIDERVWAPPPPPPPVVLPAEKKTFDYGHIHNNPPLTMQTVDYNHVSEHYYNQMYPQEDPYDQYWSQVGSAPMMPPTFLKKDRVNNFPNEEDTSHIGNQLFLQDAAKRKQLPAWIREGLEKMEQERLKRLEKERAEKEHAERARKSALEQPQKKGLLGTGEYESSSISMPSKSKFESDSENDEEREPFSEPKLAQFPIEGQKSRFSPPVEETLTEEEKQLQLMLKVRRLLTEILLDVTNSEMLAIAKEVHTRALAKAPAKPLATTTALRSIATGLNSLASYESHSDVSESEANDSDNSTSDEELHRRIQEKRRKFASKERKIIAEIEEAELREKERKKLQNNRSGDLVADSSKSKKAFPPTNKSENEVENNKEPSSQNPSLPTYDPASTQAVMQNDPYCSLSVNLNETMLTNHSTDNAEPETEGTPPEADKPAEENGNSKSPSKKQESSTSTDSESDSSSSISSSSQTSKSDRKHRRSSTNKKDYHRRDSKSKKRSRSNSPKSKHEKRKNSRRDGSESPRKSPRSLTHSKVKKRSRSKKRSKDKSHHRSESSSSSSQHYERSRRRSTSRDRHRRRRSHSHSRHRSRSTSRYHREGSSGSHSKRESYSDRHKSSGNKYRDEYHKSKRERYSRSRSPSPVPKRYRRKSRSLSLERRSHYKKSKIRTHTR